MHVVRESGSCCGPLGVELRDELSVGGSGDLDAHVIEKFESHAGAAAFAVVLLTADDRGGQEDELRPRARQNVIFELGYFIGQLGRSRVAVLYSDGVELPSDMNGVLYTPADKAGAWRLKLAREMKAAGIPTDLNQLT